MPVSYLDVVYRKILLTKFFTRGWGNPDDLRRLFNFRKIISNRSTCYNLVPKDYPIKITNSHVHANCRVIEGRFRSPFAKHLPGITPSEVHDAVFQMIIPLKWPDDKFKPVCIHLADYFKFFWRRKYLMVKPLIEKGIGAIILENPYYGFRKPPAQVRSSVHYVSDIFVMGGCLILECVTLLNWCESQGFGPLGITGISMGGHMASLAASNWPKPLVLVPCLSWSTASSVFTEGVMSESIDWDMLQNQYFNEKLYCEELSKSCKVVDDPFACSLTKNITDDYAIQYEQDIIEDLKSSYATPHEILNNLKITVSQSDCKAMDYKSTNEKSSFKPTMDSIKKITIFKPSPKVVQMKRRATEALWFMRGMMDECTHLKNFSVPVDTSLIISITAQTDGYVPRKGVSRLDEIWPGATVKYLNCGHVGAYIWYRNIFRDAIVAAFDKAKKKF
ncbi:protein ABHD18 isoform X2 [Sitophilus oryzae]|uniref:Protein ABHD18 isoform X2 n=1 Tax=Sitophilus oryzae TaxID=7048 RepID=A0A6J2X583_SITOR|nr:protein ABHD18 isoform X2 [Sitophilus oryzae]